MVFMWHVQHIMGIFSLMSIIILGSCVHLVLQSHRDERNLLLYGKVISFMHVRFQIQGHSEGFQLEGVRIIGFQLDLKPIGNDFQHILQQFKVVCHMI